MIPITHVADKLVSASFFPVPFPQAFKTKIVIFNILPQAGPGEFAELWALFEPVFTVALSTVRGLLRRTSGYFVMEFAPLLRSRTSNRCNAIHGRPWVATCRRSACHMTVDLFTVIGKCPRSCSPVFVGELSRGVLPMV